MAGRILALRDVRVLTPRTYEYVTLHDERHFADVTKVKDLEMETSILDYPEEPNLSNHLSP